MQVYKFGGASVKDAGAVKNVATILKENNFNEKVVVISAMGKTTNELENVVNLNYAGKPEWENALDALFEKHVAIIHSLYGDSPKVKAIEDVKKLIESVHSFLKGNTSRNYNYVYDQVVSAGEYISTTIVSDYANAIGIKNTLLDVKEVLFTDNAYTEGQVDFEKTEAAIKAKIAELVKTGFVITQGFVGCTPRRFNHHAGPRRFRLHCFDIRLLAECRADDGLERCGRYYECRPEGIQRGAVFERDNLPRGH